MEYLILAIVIIVLVLMLKFIFKFDDMIKRKHSPRLGDDSETLLENDAFDSKILPIRESIKKLNNFNDVSTNYSQSISATLW